MTRGRNGSRALLGALAGAGAVALVAFASTGPATGAPKAASAGAARTASLAMLTTGDIRVAVVARRLDGGATPTAEVRVALARRAGAGWHELRERRLDETFFWNTITGPRAVCRLAIASAGSSPSFRPYVAVGLLLSPSLGCGRTHRLPLPR